jgi:hypothetical protein
LYTNTISRLLLRHHSSIPTRTPNTGYLSTVRVRQDLVDSILRRFHTTPPTRVHTVHPAHLVHTPLQLQKPQTSWRPRKCTVRTLPSTTLRNRTLPHL